MELKHNITQYAQVRNCLLLCLNILQKTRHYSNYKKPVKDNMHFVIDLKERLTIV